eukprot:NODE_7512_length_770_cov_4.816074_g6901_i0.p1 GENE.NODE_7512_length_770_cov_4.816074_g6901_i0~~NODE_7512_length_770_cov_4.816074_g6901_i0.p1  ORF type:complete len:239 (-),score=34.78 NODE_7512_length_770_cov_4.816074_g6901_i0:53-709(-)
MEIFILVILQFFSLISTEKYSVVGETYLTESFMEMVKMKMDVGMAGDIVYAVGSCPNRFSISAFDGVFPRKHYSDLYNEKTRFVIESSSLNEALCPQLLVSEPALNNIHSIWKWNYPSSFLCVCNCKPDPLLSPLNTSNLPWEILVKLKERYETVLIATIVILISMIIVALRKISSLNAKIKQLEEKNQSLEQKVPTMQNQLVNDANSQTSLARTGDE